MTTVPASADVLRWAAQRARLDDAALTQRFPNWPHWLAGDAHPTLKQLEDFARLAHTPVGYLFLPAPPALALPIPDFRTLRDQELAEPSADLLDTIYLCQQRQDWYREHARMQSEPALDFIGSVTRKNKPAAVAEQIRKTLGLSVAERKRLPSWDAALRQMIAQTEDAGILVMVNSVVGANSHRKLDVGEFRGFALSDDLAPLIFLNAADSKAAQMFTLAHELAHLWLGTSGVSSPNPAQTESLAIETWCNRVAAELLMPMDDFRAEHQPDAPVPDEIQRLARRYKVSSLVALRRIFDAGLLTEEQLWHHYRNEQELLRQLPAKTKGSGGDFYATLAVRASKRFSRAIINSTLEGHTLFRDAFRLLGVRKTETFYKAARELGATT